MPRKSPFFIVLTPDKERELKHRSGKYTLPYFQVFRAKIVLMAAEDLPNDLIAARLDTRREVVSQPRRTDPLTFWVLTHEDHRRGRRLPLAVRSKTCVCAAAEVTRLYSAGVIANIRASYLGCYFFNGLEVRVAV
jgi:hypothetical protein